jgi:hypothetical protein
MMTSRSLICLLENQNGGKLQKLKFVLDYCHLSMNCQRFILKTGQNNDPNLVVLIK